MVDRCSTLHDNAVSISYINYLSLQRPCVISQIWWPSDVSCKSRLPCWSWLDYICRLWEAAQVVQSGFTYLGSNLVATLADLNVQNFSHPCLEAEGKISEGSDSKTAAFSVWALVGLANQATLPVSPRVCPAQGPDPAFPALCLSSFRRGDAFPLLANIAQSFPRLWAQDQRPPLHRHYSCPYSQHLPW
jgi:hypothetical protein